MALLVVWDSDQLLSGALYGTWTLVFFSYLDARLLCVNENQLFEEFLAQVKRLEVGKLRVCP